MNEHITFCVDINSVTNAIPSADERQVLLAIGIFNAAVAIPTAVLNALIIMAILSTPALVTPSYLLVMNLAFTDFLMGLVGQPLLSAMVLHYRSQDIIIYCYIGSLSAGVMIVSSAASIMTVTAISVDRYLAIRLKTGYRLFVTTTRVKGVLVFLWFYSIIIGMLPFLISRFLSGILGSSSIVFCIIIITAAYLQAFRLLKRHLVQIQPQNDQPTNSNAGIDVEKYKKLLKTMLMILALIIFCYTIIGIKNGILSNPKFRRSLVLSLMSAGYLNSTLSPVIYQLGWLI